MERRRSQAHRPKTCIWIAKHLLIRKQNSRRQPDIAALNTSAGQTLRRSDLVEFLLYNPEVGYTLSNVVFCDFQFRSNAERRIFRFLHVPGDTISPGKTT